MVDHPYHAPADVEDVSLEDVIRAAFEDKLLDVHTALPCKVKSYNASRNAVDVIPQVHRQIPTDDGGYIPRALPVIPDIPVAFPSAGGMMITFPVKAGDFCLVIFCEASISAWRATGAAGDPGDPARHHLSGAVALMGIRPMQQVIQNPDANNLVIGSEQNASARAIFKSSGEVDIGQAAASFVAMADKVLTELGKIASYSATHTHGPGTVTTGGPTGTPNSSYASSTVASTNLKAEE